MTLGLIADLYEPETQHWPLLFIVLSSTIGTSIGGVIGGPIEKCEYRKGIESCKSSVLINVHRLVLAMELLDPTHIRCNCPIRALLHA